MPENLDKIGQYLDAFRAFKAASGHAERVVKKAQAAAASLNNWRAVAVTPYHNIVDTANPRHLNGEEVMATYNDWHAAKKDAERAWNDIPERDREGLVPPEGADPDAQPK